MTLDNMLDYLTIEEKLEINQNNFILMSDPEDDSEEIKNEDEEDEDEDDLDTDEDEDQYFDEDEDED